MPRDLATQRDMRHETYDGQTAYSPRSLFYYRYTPGASGGPGDSASLKACQELLTEYLPKLKALPGAEVTRQVCGGCMDFKVSITQPLAEHGAWADADCAPSSPRALSQPRALVSSTAD